MDFIKALREEFSQLDTEANGLIATIAKENRVFTDDERAANDKRFARMEQINKIVSDHSRFAKLALEKGDVQTQREPEGKKEFQRSEGIVNRDALTPGHQQFDAVAYRAAINLFLKTGRRDQFTITTGTDGGAFLPKEILQPTTVRRLPNAWRMVLQGAGRTPIETGDMSGFSLPVFDDTANVGANQSESANSGTQLDASTTESISFSPKLWTSKQAWFSNTMIQAQGFDVLGYTLPILQTRKDKIQEQTWATRIMAANLNGYTTEGATVNDVFYPVGYQDIINWEHSLPPAYRPDAAFVVADSLYKVIRGIKDDYGRPIFDQDPTNVFAGKIHGRPVIVCDYLEQYIGSGEVGPGVFVSADALKIVDMMNARLVRYTNYPGMPDQTGLELFQNGDFGFIPNGVSVLTIGVG